MTEEIETIAPPPTGSVLAPIEKNVLLIDENTPTDTLLAMHDQLLFYKRQAGEMLTMVEEKMIQRIRDTGDIECGNGVRYYLSHPKTTKCLNVKGAIDALGAATGGDEALLIGCFASGAIKYGAARKILPPDKFAELFQTVVKDKLESGEPAPKELTKFDEKFSR